MTSSKGGPFAEFPCGRCSDSRVAVSTVVNGTSRLQCTNPRARTNRRSQFGIAQPTFSRSAAGDGSRSASLVSTNTGSLSARLVLQSWMY